MLLKPDGRHSHLYECEGAVKESSVAATGVDHNHETIYGTTGGSVKAEGEKDLPKPRDKEAKDQSGIVGEPHDLHRADSNARNDFIRREGRKWVVLSETGHKLGEHPSYGKALEQLKAVEVHKHSS